MFNAIRGLLVSVKRVFFVRPRVGVPSSGEAPKENFSEVVTFPPP